MCVRARARKNGEGWKNGGAGDDGAREDREGGRGAEVVFVRATINSAGTVLPPKTYRNKYAVRPVRG